MALKPIAFVTSMPSAASVTGSIPILSVYQNLYVQVPVMTGFNADTQIFVQGSHDGTTFNRFANVVANTSTVATVDFAIASAASQKMIPVPGFCFNYLRLETTATVSAGVAANPVFNVFITSLS